MMKKLLKFFLILIAIFTLAACDDTTGGNQNPPTGGGTPTVNPSDYEYKTPETDALKLTADYAGKDFIEDGIGEVSVVQYVDGDTTMFRPINGGKTFTVRYLGINTPESTYKVEPWGFAASKYTKKMLKAAKHIVLVADDLDNRVDSTGNRYLGWVWLIDENNDSRLLNLELVELAYAYSKANSTTLADHFSKAVLGVTNARCRIYGEEDPDFDKNDFESMSVKTVREQYGSAEQLIKQEHKGKKVIITGVVARMNGTNSCYIQQYDVEEDKYYGIYVYGGFVQHAEFAIGNSVVLEGKVGYYYGNLQITDVSNIRLKAWADSVNAEATINKLAIDDISTLDRNNTLLFGRLVTVNNLTVTGGSDPDSNAFTLYCSYTTPTGATGKIDVRVDANVLLKDENGDRITTYKYYLNKTFTSLTGIVSYYDYNYSDETSAYDGNVQLLLTTVSDYTIAE